MFPAQQHNITLMLVVKIIHDWAEIEDPLITTARWDAMMAIDHIVTSRTKQAPGLLFIKEL